jgi:tRNA (guanine-N7-)-methyltransferase
LRPGRRNLRVSSLRRIEVALPAHGALDLRASVAGTSEFWLEVGFGAGEHLADQAAANSGVGFIGCEPYLDGVANLAARIADSDLRNIRVFRDDARLLLDALPDESIGRAFVLFPDPWPKARHHKRRFLSHSGFAALGRVMKDGAELRIATDDSDYEAWIREHAATEGSFRLAAEFRVRPAAWPATRYEEKAISAGRLPVYLCFVRRDREFRP